MGVIALPELPRRKVAGATAVVVLHIAIVAVLLNATIVRGIFRAAPRETILLLPPLPKPEPKRIEPSARRIVPTFKLQDYRGVTLPQTGDGTSKALPGLGFQLLDCRIENISKLTEEQRVLCAKTSTGPAPDGSVDFADHSDHVHDAALWARQKARKNGPMLLPCAHNSGLGVDLGTLACLGNGIINGFKRDEMAQYGDRPEEYHVPNNGDPRPAYVDPPHR
jgi:hypothetical protein